MGLLSTFVFGSELSLGMVVGSKSLFDRVFGCCQGVLRQVGAIGTHVGNQTFALATAKVGELVMRELARLDKVAYIRFASVYRSFDTPDDFREAVLEVKKAPRRK